MDDLLLFTSTKKSHIAKLEDLLKALLKNGLKSHQRKGNYLVRNYNTWVIQSLLRKGEFVSSHQEVD